jgi:hypothetical protein
MRKKEIMVGKKKTLQTMFALIISVTLLAGCSSLFGASPKPTELDIPRGSEKYVMRAKAELSRMEGFDPNMIDTVSVEFTEFPDASLGVKEPGETYVQVATPGYIIILEYQGVNYEFHANDDRTVRVPE